MRWKLPRTERERRKALIEAFDSTRYWATRHEHSKMFGYSTLMNIGFYLLIANRDIQSVKVDALTHPDEWTRKLLARLVLLTIYEWDADEVSGRRLQEALDVMQTPADLREKAAASLRRLRTIREKTRKKFASIRNVAIGHRDPNALIQYRAIRELNVQDVWDVAGEFFGEVQAFLPTITQIMLAGNNPSSYLRQWMAATNAGAVVS